MTSLDAAVDRPAEVRGRPVGDGGRRWFGHQRRLLLGACAMVISVHVGLLVHGNLVHFPNVDEVAHLPAGVSKWRFGTFEYYRVNPPLVDLVAGLGALDIQDEYAWDLVPGPPGRRAEFLVGGERRRDVGLKLHQDFILPRLLVIPFSLLGCGLLGWLAYRELGQLPAFVACCLWCFCPNILAHAQTIVPDVGAVAVGLLPVLAALHYSRSPCLEFALWLGVALGLAMYTKLTWLTGLVSFPLVVAACSWRVPTHRAYFTVRRAIRDWLAMTAAALFVVNCGYLVAGTGTLLGDYRFASEMLGGPGSSPTQLGNRFTDTPLAWIPVPLPYDYVLGIDYLKHEVEKKYWSFLLGEWRLGSWWYYYLCTTLWKTPLGVLIAAIPAAYLLVRRWGPLAQQAWLAMAIPAAVVFLSVSLQGGFNHHHRYVLAIYPPLYFLIAGAVQVGVGSAFCRRAILSLSVLAIAASLTVWPHFLTFFNRLAGGPQQGWHVLSFSNVDWGQDLLFVEQWIEDNPDKRPCFAELEYFSFDARSLGIEAYEIPELRLRNGGQPSAATAPIADDRVAWQHADPFGIGSAGQLPQPGWYIINVRKLYDRPEQAGIGYFRFLEPVDRIAHSFLVYRIGEEERQQIAGLTELE